jgi:hypothetical protein
MMLRPRMGVAVSGRRRSDRRPSLRGVGVPCAWPLLVVLAAAGMLGPLEQARLQTLDSLNKHVSLGAWFAAIAPGYAGDGFIAPAHAEFITCGYFGHGNRVIWKYEP